MGTNFFFTKETHISLQDYGGIKGFPSFCALGADILSVQRVSATNQDMAVSSTAQGQTKLMIKSKQPNATNVRCDSDA